MNFVDDLKKEFPCSHCDAKFDSRGKRNTHVDAIHKQSHTIKYLDGIVRTITRDGEGRLIYVCGRRYEIFKSLIRHVKAGCVGSDGTGLTSLKDQKATSGKFEPMLISCISDG